MRKTILASAALLGLACGAAQDANAQNATSNTQSPPSPNAGSQMPQPTNSMPPGSGNALRMAPGDNVGMTGTPGAMPMDQGTAPMRHPLQGRYNDRAVMRGHGRAAMRGHGVVRPAEAGAAMNDQMAPPTEAYTGGARAPFSANAANITGADTRSEIAPRLPDPAASGNSPEAYLAAAQRALASGRTGAAQEALERAETRILSRSTDPAMADHPDDNMMVQHIGAARRALASRDVATARSAISAAMGGRQGG